MTGEERVKRAEAAFDQAQRELGRARAEVAAQALRNTLLKMSCAPTGQLMRMARELETVHRHLDREEFEEWETVAEFGDRLETMMADTGTGTAGSPDEGKAGAE